jgi:CopG family nickel-responsive transcriptional regulator
MDDTKGYRVGTFAVIYDHTKRSLSNALEDIQHHYSHLIKSSVHIDLNRNERFEVVVMEGDGEEIIELAEAMKALKGVELSKLATVAPKKI